METAAFLRKIRGELADLNRRITEHPYLLEAEKGTLSKGKLRRFVENQFYVVHHDARSLAQMVHRSRGSVEAQYFTKLLQGDLAAFEQLQALGGELGVTFTEFHRLKLLPEATAYTHYLAWLSVFANPGEQAFAIIVNLPVWGTACSRLGRALRERYGLRRTGFLDAFATLPDWVEAEGLEIVGSYLPGSGPRMRLIGRMIQAYEKSFWDAVYGGPGG